MPARLLLARTLDGDALGSFFAPNGLGRLDAKQPSSDAFDHACEHGKELDRLTLRCIRVELDQLLSAVGAALVASARASDADAERRRVVWTLGAGELRGSKAEAVLRKEGVPFLARRVAMSFKPERKFFMYGDTLMGQLKTLTGGWSEISTSKTTHFRTPGYRTRSTTTWKGHVLCTRTVVEGPGGRRSETTTRHYIDGDLRLVSETTSPGGTYKSFFVKATGHAHTPGGKASMQPSTGSSFCEV